MADPSVECVDAVEVERADDELEFHSFAEKDFELVAASIAVLESTSGIEEKIMAVVRSRRLQDGHHFALFTHPPFVLYLSLLLAVATVPRAARAA